MLHIKQASDLQELFPTLAYWLFIAEINLHSSF